MIDSVRPLAEAEAAHERMKAGEHFGKLVLTLVGLAPVDELVERLAVRPGAPLLRRLPQGSARAPGSRR